MKRLLMMLLLAAASLPGAVFNFSSSFETGTEGWTIKTYGFASPGGTGPVQVASGGASGGYLETEDTMNGFLFFIAPPTWTGDFTGGTLSFYLRNQNPGNYGGSVQPLVWLTDGTTDLFALSGPTMPGVSGVDWTFSSIPLSLSFPSWSTNPSSLVAPTPAVVSTVLSNVTQVAILGDWVSRYYGHPLGCNIPDNDCRDITGLDEVRLYSSEIPEPGTAGLLLLGLAAAAGWRRAGRKA
jgi:hypothetical protein